VESRERVDRVRRAFERADALFENVMRLLEEGRLEEARKLMNEFFKVNGEVFSLSQGAEKSFVYEVRPEGEMRVLEGEEAERRALFIGAVLDQSDNFVRGFSPSCEVVEREDSVTVIVKLPPAGGKVSAKVLGKDAVVTVEEGEWKSISSVRLPCRVKPETAKIIRESDGSLKVTVKKA
jgi:HSP20 family molecular chaperone IbpA